MSENEKRSSIVKKHDSNPHLAKHTEKADDMEEFLLEGFLSKKSSNGTVIISLSLSHNSLNNSRNGQDGGKEDGSRRRISF